MFLCPGTYYDGNNFLQRLFKIINYEFFTTILSELLTVDLKVQLFYFFYLHSCWRNKTRSVVITLLNCHQFIKLLIQNGFCFLRYYNTVIRYVFFFFSKLTNNKLDQYTLIVVIKMLILIELMIFASVIVLFS